jgi:hypothetical protein
LVSSRPTPERLRERLTYDAASGRLFWKFAPDLPKEWNTRYASKEAFTGLKDNGYRQGRLDNKPVLAHRVAWAIQHGAWPRWDIDHINGDKSDNRLSNLRDVPHVDNQRNMRRHSSNTTGANGVGWHKRDNRFRAYIEVLGKQQHLGNFKTLDEAIAARAAATLSFGFDPQHGMGAG